mmetsp:Transcript_20492/g.28217  ORF Transcript_20492/g.28217 Transcript_20492/m.28217 type:complete len:246 (+) Transcript_20492:1208-1945(+)
MSSTSSSWKPSSVRNCRLRFSFFCSLSIEPTSASKSMAVYFLATRSTIFNSCMNHLKMASVMALSQIAICWNSAVGGEGAIKEEEGEVLEEDDELEPSSKSDQSILSIAVLIGVPMCLMIRLNNSSTAESKMSSLEKSTYKLPPNTSPTCPIQLLVSLILGSITTGSIIFTDFRLDAYPNSKRQLSSALLPLTLLMYSSVMQTITSVLLSIPLVIFDFISSSICSSSNQVRIPLFFSAALIFATR